MPFVRIDGNRVIYSCDACGSEFQQGQGRYEGTFLSEIDMTVCGPCGPDSKSERDRQEAIRRLRPMKKAKA